LKITEIIAKCIFIICLPVLLLSVSLAWGFNSTWLFDYGFQKYNVSQTTGLPNAELTKIGGSWVKYINSNEEYWHVTITSKGQTFELFTPEEQVHFKDVKQLIWLDYRILLITLVIALSYFLTSIFWRRGKYWRQLARSIIWGSGLAILVIVILGVASVFDFDQLFLQLHFLAFTNQYWSAEGYMLLLFPGGFWYDAALTCIGFMAGLALVLGILGAVYLRITRSNHALELIDNHS
jgi:integral membrane protein (TIGR01906 family)